MFGLSPGHLLLIALVALIVIGPGKLPQSGEALGMAIRNFRRAMDGREDEHATSAAPAGPTTVTTTPSTPTAPTVTTTASAPTDQTPS